MISPILCACGNVWDRAEAWDLPRGVRPGSWRVKSLVMLWIASACRIIWIRPAIVKGGGFGVMFKWDWG